MKEKIRKFIKENQINARIIDHKESDGLTSLSAANALGVNVKDIIKVLLFIDKKKNITIIIAQGDKKIDSKNLPNLKKPRIATIQELKKYLNCQPGGVPPICLPDNINKFIDKNLKNKEFVFGSGGDRFTGMKIKIEDIIKYNKNLRWLDVVLE